MKWYWILLIALGTFLLGWWIGSMKKASLPAVTSTTTTGTGTTGGTTETKVTT